MSKHTKEPWSLTPQSEPYEDLKIVSGHRAICKLWLDDAPVHDYNEAQEANALRITLCVNACAGSSNAWLKGYGEMLHAAPLDAKPFQQNIAAIAKQRDDLLAALLSVVYKNDDGEYTSCFIEDAVLNEYVQEAIEACTGKQP